MKILIDIHHPARVHLFRNLYFLLQEKGHEVKVIYKDKEKVKTLLHKYEIPATKVGVNKVGRVSKTIEFGKQFLKTFQIYRNFKPDVVISGASPVLAWNRFLFQNKYISFSDTEHAHLTWKLSKPFIDVIVTPQNFLKDLGKNHQRVNTFKEISYLHPDYYSPDPHILSELGVKKNEPYVVLRFISWNALHDEGQKGFSYEDKIQMVNELKKKAKVFISSEEVLPEELQPYQLKTPIHKIHDVLAFANLFYGESGTMATESAVLGTPTIMVSTLAKKLGNFYQLRDKYDLMYFYDTHEEAFQKCLEILNNSDSKIEWMKKSQNAIEDMIDINQYLINEIEK